MKDYEKPSFEVFNFGADVRTAGDLCNTSLEHNACPGGGIDGGGDGGDGGDYGDLFG